MRLFPRLFPLLTLVALAGCGSQSSTTPASPAASPTAVSAEPVAAPEAAASNDWKAPPAATAQLGGVVKILGGRYSVKVPLGFTSESDLNDHAFRKGKLELGFVRTTGLPRNVTLEDYTKTTQEADRFSSDFKNAVLGDAGEVESGTVNGRPFCRFHFTYTDSHKKKLAGFGYATADGPGTFVYTSARGEPEEIEVLEACVLSFTK